MAGVAVPEAVEAPPASGTFRTSWRTQIRWVGGTAAVVAVVGCVILWLDGEFRDTETVLFVSGFVGVYVITWSLWYRLGGVSEVRVEPEAVTVRRHGGAERRIERADLTAAWRDKRWVLRTRDRKVVIRDEGFTTDDWAALSALLHDWKVFGERGLLPGVVPPDRTGLSDPEAVVFEVHRPRLPWAVFGAFALTLLGVGIVSIEDYRDGSWSDVPMITLGFPLAGAAMTALAVRRLPTLVRRVTFFPEGVRFERVVGGDRTVPYSDVLDADGSWVDARGGTFYVGRRNTDVFVRLLSERLQNDQLSGKRWVEWALMSQPRVLIGTLAGFPVIWFAVARLGAAWGLSAKWSELLVVAALVGYGFLLTGGIKLWARRVLRHAND